MCKKMGIKQEYKSSGVACIVLWSQPDLKQLRFYWTLDYHSASLEVYIKGELSKMWCILLNLQKKIVKSIRKKLINRFSIPWRLVSQMTMEFK